MIVFLFLILPHSFLRTCNWNSQGFEKPPLPRVNGIQKAIKSKLHDVLYYHPSQVVPPNKANDFPWKWRHQPALAAHQYRGDLSRNNRKEQLGTWIRWLPQEPTGTSHE